MLVKRRCEFCNIKMQFVKEFDEGIIIGCPKCNKTLFLRRSDDGRKIRKDRQGNGDDS